jgi:hypothetical protein
MSHVLPAQAPQRIGGNFWSRTWAVLVKEFIQLKRDRSSWFRSSSFCCSATR